MKTLSYKTSVKLAKWLGKDSPETIDTKMWLQGGSGPYPCGRGHEGSVPAYTLEDVLSRPFCEEIAVKTCSIDPRGLNKKMRNYYGNIFCEKFAYRYFNSGMEAVEREILRLMDEE